MSSYNPAKRQSTAMWLCILFLLPSFAFTAAELSGVFINLVAGHSVPASNHVLASIALFSVLLAPLGLAGYVIVAVFVIVANRRDGSRTPRLWMVIGVGFLSQLFMYSIIRRQY